MQGEKRVEEVFLFFGGTGEGDEASETGEVLRTVIGITEAIEEDVDLFGRRKYFLKQASAAYLRRSTETK